MKKPLLILTCLLALTANAKPTAGSWVGTWAAAAEFTGKEDMPQTTNLTDCSLRQIVHVSLGGETLRLKLSNEFSSEPVEIKAVYIADATDGVGIDVPTARYLAFNGNRSVTIEAGKTVVCDPLSYLLKPLQRLSVTICYGKAPEHATSHRGSRTTSYIMQGMSEPQTPFTVSEQVAHWYNIAAIDVLSTGEAIAVLGNSLTDGRGSTTDAQDRWTDRLAEALNGEMGVLNLGIGGNCVVRGGLSEPAVKRFDRDILSQSGVTRIIIFEGINDVGGSSTADQTVADLISAYRQFIRKGHEHGKKVYGATLTPIGQSFYESSVHEATRQAVNEWMRSSGEFDGVIDFDELVCDPLTPTQLLAGWQSDWLHLNSQGYKAMGEHAAQWLKKQMQTE